MRDKERILSAIITRIIPGLSFGYRKEDEYIENHMLSKSKLQSGDLVFANTSIEINPFIVGFVHSVEEDCVVIREIGSDRLCNYYNESFTKISKDKLGYEILEGVKYKIYQKAVKAFRDTSYTTRFKGISFNGNECTIQARKAFSNDLFFEVTFPYNSKTTIKNISEVLVKAEGYAVQLKEDAGKE